MENNKEVEVLNPNVLCGHEGSLLVYLGNFGISTNTLTTIDGKTTTLFRGDVVMFVEASDPCGTYCSKNIKFGFSAYIRVIHEDKVLDLNINPKNWMAYFTPYPRGGFVPRTSVSK